MIPLYAVVDTHPDGAFGLLSEPATLESIGAFATRYEIDQMKRLKVGEVFHYRPETRTGIRRIQ